MKFEWAVTDIDFLRTLAAVSIDGSVVPAPALGEPVQPENSLPFALGCLLARVTGAKRWAVGDATHLYITVAPVSNQKT